MQNALGMQRSILMYDLPLWAVFHYKDISGDHIISECARDRQFTRLGCILRYEVISEALHLFLF